MAIAYVIINVINYATLVCIHVFGLEIDFTQNVTGWCCCEGVCTHYCRFVGLCLNTAKVSSL